MIRYGLRSGEISRHTGPIITDTATSPTQRTRSRHHVRTFGPTAVGIARSRDCTGGLHVRPDIVSPPDRGELIVFCACLGWEERQCGTADQS
jgi:hypothetical protein